jgi:hypothetical protein
MDALIKSEFINRKVEEVKKGKKKQCFDLKNLFDLFDFVVKFSDFYLISASLIIRNFFKFAKFTLRVLDKTYISFYIILREDI